MSNEKTPNNSIFELIKEVEKEIEEATTGGSIAGYETPNAFGDDSEKSKKKTKEVSTQAGYTIVDGDIENINENILTEAGGSLKVEKGKDGKYNWLFTFKKSGKKEKGNGGFTTSADAQRDFMFKSRWMKESTITEIEKSKKKTKEVSTQAGYTVVNEAKRLVKNTYRDLDSLYITDHDWIQFKKEGNIFFVRWVTAHDRIDEKELYKLGFRHSDESRYGGINNYYKDGNYGLIQLNKSQFEHLIKLVETGFKTYGKVFADFYKDRIADGVIKESTIPPHIQSLIDQMVAKKIQRKTVTIQKDSEGHKRFMKDVQPAIQSKLLIVNHNPINDNEMWISLGPNSQNKLSEEDVIPGGLAHGKTLGDIANKHTIDVDELIPEFKKGIRVEMEHTTDRKIAKEICLDHLFENPKYYTTLAAVEESVNESNSRFKYKAMWDDLDQWADKNKYPAWMHQKRYIVSIAPKYGIKIAPKDWVHLWKVYDEMHKRFKFSGWDIDEIPFIEKRMDAIKESINEKVQLTLHNKPIKTSLELSKALDKANIPNTWNGRDGSVSITNDSDLPKAQKIAKSIGAEFITENRWLDLKNDESMQPHKKLAVGLKELRNQLSEVEKFLGWYNKIKNINELDTDNYWKRTNSNIYKIKERIINIARTLKEIEQ